MIDAAKTHLQQQSVDPHAIDLEAGTQSRCALDPETVEDYTARYRSGLYLPPVDVFYDGARYFCGDGHHRIAAARAAEIDEIAVLIHDGGREEAALFSCAANQEHGKRRTNADKRAAVEKCMRLRPFWSNSLIAEHCGVSPTTVSTVRSTLQLGESTVRQGADGRTYNTAGIGKKAAVKRLEDTEEVDAAVRALAEYVAARSDVLPLEEARSWLQLEIGVQIEDDDWEEILDEGKHKHLWQVADGSLQPRTGRVYTPDEVLSTLEDMLREAGGTLGQADARERISRELCALTDEQWSAVLDLGADERRVSLDVAKDVLVYLEDGSERAEEVPAAPLKGFDLLWRSRLERLSGLLLKSHGGTARLSQLRDSYQASGKVNDEHWDLLVRKGITAGLWETIGTGKGQQIRLVQATSSDTDTEGDRPAEYSGREQPGDEGDEDLEDEQDADEGPVLPSDPADPPRLSSASGMGAEDIDGAVQELARLLEKRQPTRVLPDTLGLTRRRLFDALGLRCLANVDWEEILDKGERGRLWVTKRKIEADGAVGGTIWLPDPTDTDTDAEQIPPSGPASAAPGASESGRAGSAPEPAAPTLFEQALAKEREHCHEESLRARSEGLRLDLERLGGKTTLAKLRRAYEGPSKSLIRTDYWHALLGYGLEVGLWVIEGERIWIELVGEDEEPGGVEGTTHRPHGEGVGQPSLAAEKAGSIPAPGTSLPNDERAEDDAYYTPERHTRGLLRWLDEALFATSPPARVLEPSVGSGNFLLSARDLWSGAKLDALDLNPSASGFDYADTFTVCDFFETELSHEYDLVVGNPPYKCDLVRWIERSLKCGRVVCYLLRGTFLGSRKRSAWFRTSGLAHVVVVSPRPKWEGPGARKQSDTSDSSDSLFFVWIRGYVGKPALHFLDLHEGEDIEIDADEEEG